jgi:hypothetical protein
MVATERLQDTESRSHPRRAGSNAEFQRALNPGFLADEEQFRNDGFGPAATRGSGFVIRHIGVRS